MRENTRKFGERISRKEKKLSDEAISLCSNLTMKEYAALVQAGLLKFNEDNTIDIKGCNDYKAEELRFLGVRDSLVDALKKKYKEDGGD